MAKRHAESKSSVGGATIDDPTYNSEGTDSFFFKPSKHDLLPLALATLVIILGLTAALLGYFLVKNADEVVAKNALKDYALEVSLALSAASTSVIRVVQDAAMFYQVSKTPITLYDQFYPYMYSGGSFPKYLTGVTYILAVPIDQVDSFVTSARAMGGDYANMTVTGRDLQNNVVAPVWTPLRGICMQTTPIANMKVLVGYDICTDYAKNKTMLTSLQTLKPACTGKIVTATVSTVNVATAVFQAIINTTTNQPYGIIAGSIVMNTLINDAVANIIKNFYVSISDSNVTAPNDPFFYSTASTTNAGMTSQQNADMIAAASYTEQTSVIFADRLFKITLIPGSEYHVQFDSSTRWIALSLSLCFMVILLVGCVVLYFTRKLVEARQKRQEASVQIDLLKTNQTALRTLLERIATQESKTRAVINALSDFICVTSVAGKILQTNAAFDSEFPFSQQELEKGVYLWDIFTELASDFFRMGDDTQEIVTQASRRFGGQLDVSVRVRNLQENAESSTQSNEHKNSFSGVTGSTQVQRPDLEEAFVIIAKDIEHKSTQVELNTEEIQKRHEFERKFREKLFRDELKIFCEKSKTVENILFLEKVREYRKATFGDRMNLKQHIFDQFIKHDAPVQLNLANNVIVEETIKINKSMADVNVFKTVEDCVIKTLANDVYPRFLQAERKSCSTVSINE
jgi:PAS domain-containing protein